MRVNALSDGRKASQVLDVAVMINPLAGRVVLLESLPVAIFRQVSMEKELAKLSTILKVIKTGTKQRDTSPHYS